MWEEQIQEAPVKVLLVGVDVGEEPDFERSMEELASLAEAATSPTSKAISMPLMLQTVFVLTAWVISLCRHLCLWAENLPSKIKFHCSSERMVQ